MIYIQILNHILEAIVVYAYMFTCCSHRRSPWIDRLIVLISYAILFGIYQIQNLNLNAFAMLSIYILLFRFLPDISWRSAVNHSLMVFSLLVLSELLAESGSNLFRLETTYAFDDMHFFLLMSIIVRVINFLLLALVIIIRQKNKDKVSLLGKNNYVTIALAELAVSMIAIQNLGFVLTLEKAEILWVYITIFSFVALSLTITILGGHLQREKLNSLTVLNELQAKKDAENYNQLISQLDNEQRILIHDFKNHFVTMKSLIEEKSYEEALKYADDMIDSPAITTGKVLSDNQTLTVLLSRYLTICREKNISISINIKNAKLSSLTPGDITALFGNLLDNSVEACFTCKNPFIDLEIYWNEEKSNNVIILTNSCETAPLQGKNGVYITKKSDTANHGIGIKSITRIVQKYHGLSHYFYDAETHSFNTIITMEKEV